jgi:hypothetical protein
METRTGYMLDTNVFNDVVDGKIEPANLNGRRLIATHVQRDELNNTTDQKRRELLLAVFEFVSADQLGLVPTESALWGVSKWDAAKWGADDGIFGAMRAADNPAALGAYQKHGFRIIGKADRHAKLHGRYVDVMIVERLL